MSNSVHTKDQMFCKWDWPWYILLNLQYTHQYYRWFSSTYCVSARSPERISSNHLLFRVDSFHQWIYRLNCASSIQLDNNFVAYCMSYQQECIQIYSYYTCLWSVIALRSFKPHSDKFILLCMYPLHNVLNCQLFIHTLVSGVSPFQECICQHSHSTAHHKIRTKYSFK